MCSLNHFDLRIFMYLLETSNIMFLSFIRFELLSFEHGNPISHKCEIKFCGSFLGYNQVFFHSEVLDFLPIYFPHILSISGKSYLFSWERLDSLIFVCTMTEKQGVGHVHAIRNSQIM